MIDPEQKRLTRERNAAKRKAKALAVANSTGINGKPVTQTRKARKRGHLSQSEKIIIGELVSDKANNDQIAAAAIVMRRPVERVASAVASAKRKFQAQAENYVDIHRKVAEQALATGNFQEARKAAEFAMTNLSARDAEGNVETIIDRDASAASGPRIQIGIALGGLPSLPNRSDDR